MPTAPGTPDRAEWPTLAMILVCYAVWILGTVWLATLWLPAAIATTAISIALHSSLTHEVVHGHPFPNQRLNDALVFPALGLLIPHARFRDTHLAHHQDARLTDPYDDPESNYMAPDEWAKLPTWQKAVLRANNTLAGRLLLGPVVSQMAFMRSDLRAIREGDTAVLAGWMLHLPALVPVVAWFGWIAELPVWGYLVAAYAAHALLKIRTFLEHQAHVSVRGRTVIIEDRGPLAWLFLNNNLHVVHHMHPRVAWYRLPARYRAQREKYLRANEGYRYAGYGDVFRRYLLRSKDPVPHPFFPRR